MKTLVYTTAVDVEKRGVKDTSIHNITKLSWQHWCERHKSDFHVIDQPTIDGATPHWFRYSIFDLCPDYDRYLYVDADIMAKWDAGNVFEECPDANKLYATQDTSYLSWVVDEIKQYQPIFNQKYSWEDYFNSGVLLFGSKHKDLFNSFVKFFKENKKELTKTEKRVGSFRTSGFDQTPFNFFIRNSDVEFDFLPERFNLAHLIQRGVMDGMQFTDLADFWHFHSITRNLQLEIVTQVWENLKENYNLSCK